MGYLARSIPTFPAFGKAIISSWFRVPSSAVGSVPPAEPLFDSLPVLPLMTFGDKNIRDASNNLQPVSFIGIDCGASPLYLRVVLQTNSHMTGTGNDQFPSRFTNQGFEAFPAEDAAIVTPNVWQHALVSFDLSGGCSIDNTPFPDDTVYASNNSFSWSLNNVSKNSATCEGGGLPDLPETKIVPDRGDVVGEVATLGPVTIPSGPFAIPTDLAGSVMQIQMAKLQVWNNRYIDAGDVNSRRLFIDSVGKPVDRSVAAAQLGPPAICFDKPADWIAGRNLGTAGNFTKTGTISKYVGSLGL